MFCFLLFAFFVAALKVCNSFCVWISDDVVDCNCGVVGLLIGHSGLLWRAGGFPSAGSLILWSIIASQILFLVLMTMNMFNKKQLLCSMMRSWSVVASHFRPFWQLSPHFLTELPGMCGPTTVPCPEWLRTPVPWCGETRGRSQVTMVYLLNRSVCCGMYVCV